MTIHRYTVPVTDYREIELGRVISAQADRGGRSDLIDIWFEVVSDPQPQGLWIFGTGHPTPWNFYSRYAWNFINTIITPDDLVWHVYVGPLKGEPVPS